MRGPNRQPWDRYEDSLAEEMQTRSPQRRPARGAPAQPSAGHRRREGEDVRHPSASCSSRDRNEASVNPLLSPPSQDLQHRQQQTPFGRQRKRKELLPRQGNDDATVVVMDGPDALLSANAGPNKEGELEVLSTSRATRITAANAPVEESAPDSTCREAAWSVWTKWRVHYLVVLLLSAILAAIFVGMDSARLARVHAGREVASLVLEASSVTLWTAAHCSRAHALDPFAPVDAPPELLTLRRTLASRDKSGKRKDRMGGPYVDYVDAAIRALAEARCGGAVQHLNDLFIVLVLESQRVGKTSGDDEHLMGGISTFAHAWDALTGQLQSEGLLQPRESPPMASLRALTGLADNALCESPVLETFALAAAPRLGDVVVCDNATRDTVLHTAPILQPPQIDLQAVFPLFASLTTTWAARVPSLPKAIPNTTATIDFALHGVIIVTAALGVYALVRVATQRHREERTETVVRRDFRLVPQRRRRDEVVAMTQRTLRLIDHYCWHLGCLDLLSARDAAHGLSSSSGLNENEDNLAGSLIRARRGRGSQRKKSLASATGDGNVLRVGSPLDTGDVVVEGQWMSTPSSTGSSPLQLMNRFRKMMPAGRASRTQGEERRPLGGGLARVESPREETLRPRLDASGPVSMTRGLDESGADMDLNEVLLSQPRVRASLLHQYAWEYSSLRDATQIHLYLHQLVHPLLLLQPFLPSYMTRPLGLPQEEYRTIGPAMQRGSVVSGVVMREGLEGDPTSRTTLSPDRASAAAAAVGPVAAMPSSPLRTDACHGDRSTAYWFVSFRAFNSAEAVAEARCHHRRAQAGQRSDRPDGKWLAPDGRALEAGEEEMTRRDGGRATDVTVTGTADDADSGSGGGEAVVGGCLVSMATTRPGSGTSTNPLSGSGTDDGGISRGGAAAPPRYPLSVVAAGVNVMLHSIRRASAQFGGDVVQVTSDGVLVQFRPPDLVDAPQSHRFAFGALSFDEDANSRVEEPWHRRGDRLAPRIAAMGAAERAARAALLVESRTRHYLETSDTPLVPAELLHCAQFVLSDQLCDEWCSQAAGSRRGSISSGSTTGSLRGVVEFHVSKHYCVLSRCMPLIVSLEQVALQHASHRILITPDVSETVGPVAVTRPMHYLDIPNLNMYYFPQRPVPGEGGRQTGAAAKSAPKAEGESDAAASAATGAAEPPLSASTGGNAQGTAAAVPFHAAGTVYELQSIAPLDESSAAYLTFAEQRDRTQAQREHWLLIWKHYVDILSMRRSVRVLRPYLDKISSVSALQRGAAGAEDAASHRPAALRISHSHPVRHRFGLPGDNDTANNDDDRRGSGESVDGGDVVMLLVDEEGNKPLERSTSPGNPPTTAPVAGDDASAAVISDADGATALPRRRGSLVGSGAGVGGAHREAASTAVSNGGSPPNAEASSPPGSAGGMGSLAAGGGWDRSRMFDSAQVAALVTRLMDCLKELGSYGHIYRTFTREEESTLQSVAEDIKGMLLALGVSEKDIEW